MSYREDKFAVGDMVTWFDDRYAELTHGRATIGNGPFRVRGVIDQPKRSIVHVDDGEQSNWDSMGHTQHIVIEISKHYTDSYSGAFFKKV